MSLELLLSVAAIAISFLSLSVSTYQAWIDRSRIATSSGLYVHEESGDPAVLWLKAINIGRRPALLRYLRGTYSDGSVGGVQLDNNGVRLNEGEFYETKIGKFDGLMILNHDDGKVAELVELYLEDSAETRYYFKGSKENIMILWQSKHPFELPAG